MQVTLINERWSLVLPDHRAARPEWPVWEKERLAAMFDVIRPGDVVYDIGAEEGDLPALWSSWGADVVLVEPNPRVWPNIKAIWEANQLRPPIATWVGFAADHGQQRGSGPDWPEVNAMHVAGWPDCADGPIIGDHGFLVLPERPDCPATTIDDLADYTGRPPTVITLDVEGAEFLVLSGARDVLTADRPAVFVSVHIDMPWVTEKFDGATGPRIVELLEGLGYTGRHLVTDHEEHWEWRHPEGR